MEKTTTLWLERLAELRPRPSPPVAADILVAVAAGMARADRAEACRIAARAIRTSSRRHPKRMSWPANAGHPVGFCNVRDSCDARTRRISNRRHLGGPHSRAMTGVVLED